jgi:hypothetical protein
MAKKTHDPHGAAADARGGDENGNGLGGLVKSFQGGDQFYFVDIKELNGSGVSGGALLSVSDGGTPGNLLDDTLTVTIAATGLEPNQVHIQHIHGEDGTEAVTPPPSADTDGDGFIELAEGAAFYKGILLNLTSPQGGGLDAFPTAPDGSILFSATYHLHPDAADTGHDGHASGDVINNFADLDEYEIVLHGLSVGAVGDGTTGEIDGTAGYKLVLPVASGEIQQLDAARGVSALAQLVHAFDGHGSEGGDWFL